MYFHYLKKALKALGAGVFIAAGIWSYGQTSLFVQVYFILLGFIALLFIRDVNMLGLIFLEAVAHIGTMLAWHFLDDILVIKIFVYGFIFLSLYLLKYEEKRKYIIGFMAVSLSAEIYWLVIGYDAPKIYYYLILINLNVILRHFLFRRVFITAQIFPGAERSLEADIDLYNLTWLYMLTHIAMVSEYLLRHIFGLNMILIYDLSSYIFHGLGVYTAWIIFAQGTKLLSQRWIHA